MIGSRLLVMIAIAAAVIIAGCVGSGYTPYENTVLGLKVEAPSNWTRQATASGVAFGGPLGSGEYYTGISILLALSASEGGNYSTVAEVVVAMKEQIINTTLVTDLKDYGITNAVSTAATGSLNSFDHARLTATYESQGSEFKQDIYLLESDGVFYLLMYTGYADLFNVSQRYWAHALETFRITGAATLQPGGELSCTGISECISTQCTTVSSSCISDCVSQGTDQAQSQFMMYTLCIQTNCADVQGTALNSCITQSCSTEMAACVGMTQ